MSDALSRMADNARQLQEDMQSGSLLRGILRQHEQDIMEQQHIQLLEGKGSDGNDLRPYYTEDIQPYGYFKTVQSAANYMAWKETLNYPYSVQRGNSNAPNLYINGRFYSEMEVKFEAETIMIAPSSSYAAQIMGKYGIQRFGLSALKWQVMMNEKGVRDEVQQQMKRILYGN
jgi:hypothetical protein